MTENVDAQQSLLGDPVRAERAQESPLDVLRQQNREIMERFNREGDNIDQGSLVGLRLDVLTDMLLPPQSPFRDIFEMAFEANLNRRLLDLDSERTKARLLEGVRTKGTR